MNRLIISSLLLALAFPFTRNARADSLLVCGFEEVFAVSPETLASGKLEKPWSWRARDRNELPKAVARRFGTTDDCKPIHGGRQILITSSGGGCALVDYPSGDVRWFAVVTNAHSIELLPGNRVVVASSTGEAGNRLVLFDLSQSEKPIWHTPLESAHGVVWDEARQSLWALGLDELRRYSLVDWGSNTPSLKLERSHPLPDQDGHDLQPVPGADDLVATTSHTVSLFNRDSGEFRPHPALKDRAHVKSVAIHPATGKIYFTQGDAPDWWSTSIQSPTAPTRILVKGERVYKIRWLLDEKP